MKRKVINYECLPPKMPIFPTITAWLLMDRLGASDLVIGAVLTVFGLICLAGLYSACVVEYGNVRGFGKRTDGGRDD